VGGRCGENFRKKEEWGPIEGIKNGKGRESRGPGAEEENGLGGRLWLWGRGGRKVLKSWLRCARRQERSGHNLGSGRGARR
jgi:hypothetical protein